MSRIMKVMIVLLTIAAMVTPVMAEDRLSLNGQMRVRGWYLDDERASEDYTSSFMDQRLRIGGKFSIAEGVSVTFRFDETESAWGDQPGNGSGRFVDGTDRPMQWDRAHLDITKGSFHLRAGQQFLMFGNSGFDAQDNGLVVDFNGPVKVTLFGMIDDNNHSYLADSRTIYSSKKNYNSDDYYFGAQVGFKAGIAKVDVYGAGQTDKVDASEKVFVLGANGKFDLAPVKLEAELDYFTGDADKAAGIDAIGTNLYVDASAALSDTITLGGQLYYAVGTDKSDEAQYYCLGNEFGGWDALFILGTGLDNEKAGMGRPWDLGDALGYEGNTGIQAIRGYASFKATDTLTLSGSVAYAEPEEDGATSLDSALLVAVGASYDLMANTKLAFQGEYKDISADETSTKPSDPTVLTGGVALFVNF